MSDCNTTNINNMQRVIGNDYCTAISPPTAQNQCLHTAMFYRSCPHPKVKTLASAGTTDLPLAPGPCTTNPSSRVPTLGRYPVLRLCYRAGPSMYAFKYKLFVETARHGSIRGLYIDRQGSDGPEPGYHEEQGDEPRKSPGEELMCQSYLGTIAVEDLDIFRDVCSGRPPPMDHLSSRQRFMCAWRPLHRPVDWTEDVMLSCIGSGILDIRM